MKIRDQKCFIFLFRRVLLKYENGDDTLLYYFCKNKIFLGKGIQILSFQIESTSSEVYDLNIL